MKNPMGCEINECRLVEIAVDNDSPESAASPPQAPSALDAYAEVARDAYERLCREAKAPCLRFGDRTFVVRDGSVVGRHGDIAGDLAANDRSVSRRHAQFVLGADGWRLRNLAVSGSPLIVDGERLAPEAERRLAQGRYRMRLGDRLILEIEIP